MEYLDAPHFHTTTKTTGHLSISTSMKISKSILSPIRGHRGSVSFSFISRRLLRPSGSLKAGQASPFFAKKRVSTFENPEPSSPKVTCIGQVRVKSKKKAKQCRSLSRRRINGEASFRKVEQSHGDGCGHYPPPPPQECLPQRNQRWVLLPISVCEALRAFGAEFSCLFPCRSSCFSRGNAEKSPNENGCGAVFARWLVSVNDSEGGKRREIELVVGGGDEAEDERSERMTIRSSRRHVFEDFEVKDDRIEVKGQSMEGEEEARVSICIPPKNALLLMRCRSDPMKMATLVNKFSCDAPKYENDEDIEEEMVDFDEQEDVLGLCEGKEKILVVEKVEVFEQDVAVSGKTDEEQKIQKELVTGSEEKEQEIEEAFVEAKAEEEKEEVESNMSSFENLLDQENEDCPIQEQESPTCRMISNEVKSLPEEAAIEKDKDKPEESTTSDKDTTFVNNNGENQETARPGKIHHQEEQKTLPPTELEAQNPENQETKKEKESPGLPECLLLMMCEPKLSMEVSKETWVRGTDFIRWLPERPRRAAKSTRTGGCEHEPAVKKRPSTDSKPKLPSIPAPPAKKTDQQPPRSSCSLPAASMASVIEQKLVNAGALTRCNSEPMRTAAAKLMPESCFMKLEPHREGVGAAGVGF